jgi:hypothetical protein
VTAGLTAGLAVLLAAVVVLLLARAGLKTRLADERERADAAERGLSEAVATAGSSAEQALRSEREALEAGKRADMASARASEAEARAEDSDRRRDAAEKRAAALERAHEAGPGPDPTTSPMWELERVRAEREWADVVGPGVSLPVEWEPSVGAVVGIELEIIKEVVGTPAVFHREGVERGGSAGPSPIAARLSAELVRKMARAGEEMTVTAGPSEMTISQQAGGAGPPDLAPLIAAAAQAGGELGVSSQGGVLTTRFVYP